MLVACKPTARGGRKRDSHVPAVMMDGPSVSMSLRAETSRRKIPRHGLRCSVHITWIRLIHIDWRRCFALTHVLLLHGRWSSSV